MKHRKIIAKFPDFEAASSFRHLRESQMILGVSEGLEKPADIQVRRMGKGFNVVERGQA